MRLYFDCPTQASYMEKYFGVKFLIELKTKDGTVFDIINVKPSLITIDQDRYFVAPESEAIFQPKEGDDVLVDGRFYSIKNSQPRTEKVEIIMRDNKHFFNALREEENDI